MEKLIPKKQSKSKQVLLVILLIVILFAIGYFIYVYLIDRPGATPEELAGVLLMEEEIAEITFEAEVVTEPPFSELESYGQPIDPDKVKTGRDNPFISY